MCGKLADMKGEFLSWNVPITNFPVVQYYTEGVVRKFYIQYGEPVGEKLSTGYYRNTYQVAICVLEDMVPSHGKQSQGAAPNVIHSFDAGHLMLVVAECPFAVSTIHDSYGALLCDMDDLFRITREQFVKFHECDPLSLISDTLKLSNIEKGTLQLKEVLDPELS